MHGRAALLDWLNQLIDRLTLLQVPGHVAMDMIRSEYLRWQCEALGQDPDDGA